MKKYYRHFFENKQGIDYWRSIYKQQDFYGDCFRQRADIALAWVDGLALSESSIVFDVGCGTGGVTAQLVRREHNVMGMDFSYGMLLGAKANLNLNNDYNVAFLAGDIESLPIKSASIDVAISLGVVAYLSSAEKALREFARILKPGGVLIISIVNKARAVNYLDVPFLIMKLAFKIRKRRIVSQHMSTDVQAVPRLTTYFIPKFRKSLEAIDFTVCEYQTVPYELLTFFGREIFPQSVATRISMFFERFSNVPLIQSFGGMCVFKAEKNLF